MFKLFFATPEKRIVAEEELESITLPAHSGELNILPNHAPLMTTLTAGILSYKLKNGVPHRMAIGWGYCQVNAEGVLVLAETADHGSELNLATIQKKLSETQSRLATESLSDQDWQRVQNDISRLKAQLQIVNSNN